MPASDSSLEQIQETWVRSRAISAPYHSISQRLTKCSRHIGRIFENLAFRLDFLVAGDYIVTIDLLVSADCVVLNDGSEMAGQMAEVGVETVEKPTARANRASRRALRSRQRLMQAALALFSEKGIEGTSINDITERADLGKGTFYRHFKTKEEIAVALVEEAVDRLLERIEAVVQAPSTLEEMVAHLVQAHATFFMERQEEFLLLFQGRLLLKLQRGASEELERPYLKYLEAIENKVSPYVSQPTDATRIRRFACALAGFVSGFFSFAMIGMKPEEMETSLGPMRSAFVATSSKFLGR